MTMAQERITVEGWDEVCMEIYFLVLHHYFRGPGILLFVLEEVEWKYVNHSTEVKLEESGVRVLI